MFGVLIRLLSHVVPFGLRWYYTTQRLSKLMRVTVSSENEGLVVNCSDIPEAHVWLEITNHSPFSIEVHAISANLLWGGRVGRFLSVATITIKPHSTERAFIETTLTAEQARKACAISSKDSPRLNIHLEASCRLRRFALTEQEIKTKNYDLRGCSHVKDYLAGSLADHADASTDAASTR